MARHRRLCFHPFTSSLFPLAKRSHHQHFPPFKQEILVIIFYSVVSFIQARIRNENTCGGAPFGIASFARLRGASLYPPFVCRTFRCGTFLSLRHLYSWTLDVPYREQRMDFCTFPPCRCHRWMCNEKRLPDWCKNELDCTMTDNGMMNDCIF